MATEYNFEFSRHRACVSSISLTAVSTLKVWLDFHAIVFMIC